MDNYPPVVQAALVKMDEQQKLTFESMYNQGNKNKTLLIILSIVFPIQLFLLGKTGLGMAFLLTFGGFGTWYIVEWFLTPKRVDDFNAQLAIEIARNIKIMN